MIHVLFHLLNPSGASYISIKSIYEGFGIFFKHHTRMITIQLQPPEFPSCPIFFAKVIIGDP